MIVKLGPGQRITKQRIMKHTHYLMQFNSIFKTLINLHNWHIAFEQLCCHGEFMSIRLQSDRWYTILSRRRKGEIILSDSKFKL